MMTNLLIFGAGPFAQLMAGYFEADTSYVLKAFVRPLLISIPGILIGR